MIAILYVLIVMQFISIIGTIVLIDQPRKPITKPIAAISCIISILVILLYISIIERLGNV